MRRDRWFGTSEERSPLVFFLLVLVLSIPIWAVGPLADRILPDALTDSLPFSSLMAFTPMIAAVILVGRDQGLDAAKNLLRRAFDYKRIRYKVWYLTSLCIMPAMMILQYALMARMGGPLPKPQIPVLTLAASFVVFFVAGAGEELGWQGYVIDPLQRRWNALTASVMLGTVWATWHIVPLIQASRSPAWIIWQCMSMVTARILIVWLYNNTRKSVLAAILFHAMTNVATVLLPAYGWPYSPFAATIFLTVSAAIVTFLWSPSTLASFRYDRACRDVQTGVAH